MADRLVRIKVSVGHFYSKAGAVHDDVAAYQILI